jgi:hypothetical protein
VRVFLQKKHVLAHDESPDGVIDRCVIVVSLIDCELEQMFRTSADRRVAVADTALRFHRQAPWEIKVTYDSFRQGARLIPSLAKHGGSASPEDDSKWIAKDA